jgi:hypothetical protein
MAIVNASADIIDNADGQVRVLGLRDINLKVSPQSATSVHAAGSKLLPFPPINFVGTVAGDNFQRIDVACHFDPARNTWSAKGTAEDLQLSPQLHASLPRDLSEQLAPLAAVGGRMRLNFDCRSGSGGEDTMQFVVSGRLSQGQIHDRRLPYPLTDVQADVHLDNRQIKIEQVTARSGPSHLRLSWHRQGWQANSPWELRVKARQLALDGRLAKVLPDELQSAWRMFSPAGLVNADLNVTYDGQRQKPELAVEGLDVSFAYQDFPYRFHSGVGTIHLKDSVLSIRFRALAAGQVARFDGQFQNPGPDFTGGLSVTLDRPIPLDESLLRALSDTGQRIVRSLQPRGLISFNGRFERRDPGQERVDQHLEVGLHNCAVKYQRFPYPLERIEGTLAIDNDRWEFRNLVGHNDSGYVVCRGNWTPHENADGGQLSLDFIGSDVPLEDELREALSPVARRIWSDLQPRGSIDYLKIGARYDSAQDRLSVEVRAEKWYRSQNVEGRTIRIEPSWLPYRLDDVTGIVHYRDGHVELEKVTAVHGSAKLSLTGSCDFSEDGRWRIRLDRLNADRLQADRDLIAALPPKLSKPVMKLNLSGPVIVHGSLEMSGRGMPDESVDANWDLAFDVENGSLSCGLQLDHIHGGIRLVGSKQGPNFQSRGELEIDSLIFQEFQLTQISGPVWIDQSRVAFGSWAERGRRDRPPRQIMAQAFGGTLSADADIGLTGDSQFALQAALVDGDLKRISEEAMHRQRDLSGMAFAGLKLRGSCKGMHTLRGDGMVRLRDANIYEVPLMLALLKLLSVRQPDKTAFTTSDIDFRIQGDHIYLDRVNFNGDAISLRGNGWMDLQRHINLNFYSLVGRDNLRVPLISDALGLASQQILLIHVGGTLDEPELKREAFPGLNDTLQQIFPEVAKQQNRPAPSLLPPMKR